MSARVTDLQLLELPDATWLEFTWSGDFEEWNGALGELKAKIPAAARSFNPATKRWRVAAELIPDLEEIFPNLAGALDAIRSQVRMF